MPILAFGAQIRVVFAATAGFAPTLTVSRPNPHWAIGDLEGHASHKVAKGNAHKDCHLCPKLQQQFRGHSPLGTDFLAHRW